MARISCAVAPNDPHLLTSREEKLNSILCPRNNIIAGLRLVCLLVNSGVQEDGDHGDNSFRQSIQTGRGSVSFTWARRIWPSIPAQSLAPGENSHGKPLQLYGGHLVGVEKSARPIPHPRPVDGSGYRSAAHKYRVMLSITRVPALSDFTKMMKSSAQRPYWCPRLSNS